jgi:hypothetical protein
MNLKNDHYQIFFIIQQRPFKFMNIYEEHNKILLLPYKIYLRPWHKFIANHYYINIKLMMKVYTNYEFVAYYIMLKHVKKTKIENK